MSCDIHFVVEKKYRDKWIGVHKDHDYHFDVITNGDNLTPLQKLGNRNYKFFGLLANVRTEGLPGSEKCRTLPEDISDLAHAEIDEWDVDGHSHSWHSLEEFVKKYLLSQLNDVEIVDAMKKKLQGENPVHEFFPNIQPKEWSKYRVVFWFDN